MSIMDEHGRRWEVIDEIDWQPRRRRRWPARTVLSYVVRLLLLAGVLVGIWWTAENPETAPMVLGGIAGAVIVGYVVVLVVGGAFVLLAGLFDMWTDNDN